MIQDLNEGTEQSSSVISSERRAFHSRGGSVAALGGLLLAGAIGVFVYSVSDPAPRPEIMAAQIPNTMPARQFAEAAPRPAAMESGHQAPSGMKGEPSQSAPGSAPQPSTVTPPVQESQQPASDATQFGRNQSTRAPDGAAPPQPEGTPNVANTTPAQQPGVHAPDRAVPQSR